MNNGELEYACTDGYFSRNNRFHEGEGILIDFKHVNQKDDYYWSINLSNGSWGKGDWRQFGISDAGQSGQAINLMQGTTWFGGNTRWIKTDVWYRLALAVDENGRIVVSVWERDKPDAPIRKYTTTMGKGWSGLEWLFWVNNTHNVVLALDNYYEFAFSKIK